MKALHPVFALSILTASAWSQVNLGTYNGCTATDAEFTRTRIVNNTAPQVLKLAFDLQANNVVDVYFIQKGGQFRKYTGSTGLVTTLGTVPTVTSNEDGLVGLVLDPAFKTNRYLYMMYSYNTGESTFRISRFMLNGTGNLDLPSEKVLIRIPSVRGRWHTSGAMQFDDYGDLWITIGDNEQTENGPANTSDMRGGILRIHPDNSTKGYSIPAGNFGAVMAARYATSNPALAAQYADTTRVKAETYVKGTRNAYTMYVDPVRRWLLWGDVGPDQGQVSEEYNLEKAPDYMGWPYFAGAQSLGGVTPYGVSPTIPSGIVKTAPVNNLAGLLGVRQLPAVNDPIYQKNQSCAMTGPIFRYNGDNYLSASQFPPQMSRKWLVADCNGGYGYHLLTLNAAGDAITANQTIWAGFLSNVLTDIKQAPDGSVYIAQQGANSIDQIEYTGSCRDQALKLETVITKVSSRAPTPEWLKVGSRLVSVLATGPHSIQVMDMKGRTVLNLSGDGAKTHVLPVRDAGVYYLTVTSSKGTATSVLPPF